MARKTKERIESLERAIGNGGDDERQPGIVIIEKDGTERVISWGGKGGVTVYLPDNGRGDA